MTLENCKKLLVHFESIANGSIPAPVGHVNWNLVKEQAKVNADLMRDRVKKKEEKLQIAKGTPQPSQF